ncbi:hypothetical protein HK100_010275 [Physocladia obscura]|uniref:Uncharacterized protein n=1 Tax=Physocladia obscura TaxID=109957 RepID=A0AAD5T4A9_9FUNG|nr:hypothetical protein HK100_010275 [Physocladia obscura]
MTRAVSVESHTETARNCFRSAQLHSIYSISSINSIQSVHSIHSSATLSNTPSLGTVTPAPPLIQVPQPPGSEDCSSVWDIYNDEVTRYNEFAHEKGLPLINPDQIDPSVDAFREMERNLKKHK